MGESSITYEELFELLRRERNSEELQTLDPNFYPDLVDYFQEKKEVLDDKSEEAEMFGSSEKENVEVQLENARKIARELMDRREKKIMLLALNNARTESDIIDTSSLLEVEQEFFHECCALFRSYKKGVLEKVSQMEMPVFGDVKSKRDEEPAAKAGEETPESDDTGKEPLEPETPEDDSEPETPEETQPETVEGKKVRFKASIPKFMGKNEEVYGPFEDGEEAAISEEIAEILISKGKAEEVE